MDQCFHWLKCCNAQRQFLYLWCRGIDNHANYASKHHPAKHHQAVHPFYIQNSTTPMNYFPLSSLICSPCFHKSWSLDPFLWRSLVTSQACTCKGVLLSCLIFLKPYASPIRELEMSAQDVHKKVGFRIVIIPIIQPGYSGYSSTILPLTRLLKTLI